MVRPNALPIRPSPPQTPQGSPAMMQDARLVAVTFDVKHSSSLPHSGSPRRFNTHRACSPSSSVARLSRGAANRLVRSFPGRSTSGWGRSGADAAILGLRSTARDRKHRGEARRAKASPSLRSSLVVHAQTTSKKRIQGSPIRGGRRRTTLEGVATVCADCSAALRATSARRLTILRQSLAAPRGLFSAMARGAQVERARWTRVAITSAIFAGEAKS